MARGNDKGFITWIFTLITLILNIGILAAAWATFGTGFDGAFSGGDITALIWGIVTLIAAVYLWWHGIMILIGKGENTWTFVIVAFFATAIIGGILMLIAKILN